MQRVPVSPRHAYRLINHGPTTLVTSRAGTRSNVMAAQWVMPTDYEPMKLVIVLDRTTYTHELFTETGVLGFSVPAREQAELAWRVGSSSGRDIAKLASIDTFQATTIDVPMVEGCIAWLEARALRSPSLDQVAVDHELVVMEVLAAYVDARCWRDERIELEERQTLHHLGGGVFRASGDLVDAR